MCIAPDMKGDAIKTVQLIYSPTTQLQGKVSTTVTIISPSSNITIVVNTSEFSCIGQQN